MILINIPSEWSEEVEAGMAAVKESNVTGRCYENPYDDEAVEHDYWALGAMAAEHGWDIEW
jgi:hypothetical protein